MFGRWPDVVCFSTRTTRAQSVDKICKGTSHHAHPLDVVSCVEEELCDECSETRPCEFVEIKREVREYFFLSLSSHNHFKQKPGVTIPSHCDQVKTLAKQADFFTIGSKTR
jgi:hypothetical protein